MIWLLLVLAIASEVTATLSLRASEGLRRRRWIPVIVVGYLAAFSLLGTILAMG
ncbi:MAG: QacE family quaternary ammonium compound efflux SMR transporter, partial [Microbacterium sp.]|nr:QacE family quaternary ammonium compound efflux SMR transporter [Microbacterium sp.]